MWSNFKSQSVLSILLGAAAVQVFAAGFSLSPTLATTNIPTNDAGAPLFGDKIIAKGTGVEITQSQLDEAFTNLKVAASAQGQAIPESRRNEAESEALDRLIHCQLLRLQATDADHSTAKARSDKAFAELQKGQPSPEAFRRQLLVMGMTEEKFKARLYDEALFKEVVDHQIKSKVIVTDDQVKQFFQENSTRFDLPERVQLSQILFLCRNPQTRMDLPEAEKKAKRKLAEQIWQRIMNGEDFAKLAKEQSEDPDSRDAGGELPVVTANNMTPELAKVAFSLTNNQVSDVIASPVGYHLLKLREKLPAKKAVFADAEKDIRDYLAFQETQKRLPEYLKTLRQEAGVVILSNAPSNNR